MTSRTPRAASPPRAPGPPAAPDATCRDPRCFAAIAALSARLQAAEIATAELARWRRERGLGEGRIMARVSPGRPVPETLDEDSRRALGGDLRGDLAGAAFRSVRLVADGEALVDAHNWFFPERLTADMRRALADTDTPFGEAIAALRPQRRTLLVRQAAPGELACPCAAPAPGYALELRALLSAPDGAPLALVHEKYRAVLVCAALRDTR